MNELIAANLTGSSTGGGGSGSGGGSGGVGGGGEGGGGGDGGGIGDGGGGGDGDGGEDRFKIRRPAEVPGSQRRIIGLAGATIEDAMAPQPWPQVGVASAVGQVQ